MAWLIQCSDKKCKGQTWAKNIVDLIRLHCDEDGYFLCGQCKKPVGYVEKSFELQEIGEKWEPFLRGIIPQGSPGDSYQPFVFLVSYKPGSPVNNVWFSYYKDLRKTHGRLKLGYGPGGPPVLGMEGVLRLLRSLVDLRCITRKEVMAVTAK